MCPATHAAMNQLVHPKTQLATIQDVPVPDFNDMMDRAQIAKKLIKSLEEECKRRAVLRQPGLGWTIGEGDMMRIIEDPKAAFDALSGFMSADEFLLLCKPSITKIEGAVKEKMDLTGAQAKSTTNDLLGDVIIRKQKSGSLERVKLQLPPK